MKMPKLREVTDAVIADIKPLIDSYPWESASAYISWLSQQYHIVHHSTPMLALCCGRSIANQEFHRRCIEHLAEEKGHDKMLLNDIKLSKGSLQAEIPSARAFYATQYYQIEHRHPSSFLGYILFMEALAVACGKDVANKASKSSKGVTFLRLHADEDDGHIDSAFKIIEGLMANEQVEIAMNLLMAATCYKTMMEELLENQAAKLEAA